MRWCIDASPGRLLRVSPEEFYRGAPEAWRNRHAIAERAPRPRPGVRRLRWRRSYGRIDRHRSGGILAEQLHLAILDQALQAHVARGQCGQRIDRGRGDVDHGEILQARERRLVLVPPDVGSASAVVHDDHLARAAAGLADALLVRLAEFDPFENVAGKVLAPQVRFFVAAEALAE